MKLLIFCLVIGVAMGLEEPCPTGSAYWPHPNCNLYYVCDNGNAVLSECPDGLFWNQFYNYCDFPSNVPECQGGTREPDAPTTVVMTTTPTTTTTTPTTTTTRATTTTPTTTRATTTPTTIRTTRVTTTPTKTTTEEIPETEATEGPLPGVCPPEGIHKISHETRCESYYICISGIRQPEVFDCAEGLFFDPSIEECNLATEVDCVPMTTTTTVAPTRPNLPECPPSGIWQLPYPGNCTLYIMCVEEVPILYRCPDGMLFDALDYQCKPQDIAVCAEFNLIHDKAINDKGFFWTYFTNLVR